MGKGEQQLAISDAFHRGRHHDSLEKQGVHRGEALIPFTDPSSFLFPLKCRHHNAFDSQIDFILSDNKKARDTNLGGGINNRPSTFRRIPRIPCRTRKEEEDGKGS